MSDQGYPAAPQPQNNGPFEPSSQPANPPYPVENAQAPWAGQAADPGIGQQPQWGQQASWGQQPQWGGQQPQQPQWGQPAQWGQQPGWGQPPGVGQQQYIAPPKPGVIPLRPLSLGEILDGAFQAARRNGKAMFGSALLLQAGSTVLGLLVIVLAVGSAFNSLLSLGSNLGAGMSRAEVGALGDLVLKFGVGFALSTFITVIGTMILQGVLVVPVLRATVNRRTTFKQMWRLAKPKIWSLVLLALLYSAASVVVIGVFVTAITLLSATIGLITIPVALLLGIGLTVLVVWAVAKLLIAPAVIVVEQLGVFAAIKRSWQLTTGHWWRTFGTFFLAQLIVGTISGFISVPIGMLFGLLVPLIFPNPTGTESLVAALIAQVVSYLISSLVAAVAYAFQSGVLALIYVDLRMRKEGFDLLLLKELETASEDNPDGIPGGPVSVPGSYQVPQ